MPKLDLFFELFIIMISVTKEQQHRITYLCGSRDSASYVRHIGACIPYKWPVDAWSGFDLGYMKACKGFGLFTTTWVVVGVAHSIPLHPMAVPYLRLTAGRSHRTFLVNVFFVHLNSLYGMVSRANIYPRFLKSCFHTAGP